MKGLHITASALLWSAATTMASDLKTVDKVDLDRYLGLWYEIASYPSWFQRDCTGTTAEYTWRDDGLIKVVNTCRKGSLDGSLKRATGRAKVVDVDSNAKLKVSFFGPFWGDYWILELDPDYQWAVVSVPSRKYLWILSRTPRLDATTYQQILELLPGRGFDLSRLDETEQPSSADQE